METKIGSGFIVKEAEALLQKQLQTKGNSEVIRIEVNGGKRERSEGRQTYGSGSDFISEEAEALLQKQLEANTQAFQKING